ncbi:MAG: alpha-ketoglutarate-dependent dioxygenase AlkB [Methylomonas sp.]|jgi:alkylated DNA repair dioxygenase AlkB
MSICADFELIAGFYGPEESEQLYNHFLQDHYWPENRYQFAGRQFVLPRLQTWHADAGIRYSYSNNLLETRPWTPVLSEIRTKVETFLGFAFNSVLVNRYRHGDDHVGWHADNEPELGEQPFIASVSFGAARRFEFKHKKTAQQDGMVLSQGSLLIMRPDFQHYWLHRVPVDRDVVDSRINLTFRKVVMV